MMIVGAGLPLHHQGNEMVWKVLSLGRQGSGALLI